MWDGIGRWQSEHPVERCGFSTRRCASVDACTCLEDARIDSGPNRVIGWLLLHCKCRAPDMWMMHTTKGASSLPRGVKWTGQFCLQAVDRSRYDFAHFDPSAHHRSLHQEWASCRHEDGVHVDRSDACPLNSGSKLPRVVSSFFLPLCYKRLEDLKHRTFTWLHVGRCAALWNSTAKRLLSSFVMHLVQT